MGSMGECELALFKGKVYSFASVVFGFLLMEKRNERFNGVLGYLLLLFLLLRFISG